MREGSNALLKFVIFTADEALLQVKASFNFLYKFLKMFFSLKETD